MRNTNNLTLILKQQLFIVCLIFIFFLLPLFSQAATDVYYSVGTNATDLKNGPAAVTISGGVAVFNVSQPNKIGVGDKITYAGNVSYISGRINSTAYNVTTAKGSVPANVSNQAVNNITRAFNSLDDAVDAADGGVCANDTEHLNTSNLTEGNYTLNIACYSDGVDTTAVMVDGWTTGADNYIKVYTPVNSNEVGVSQRHDGKWDADAYILTRTNDGANIRICEDYIIVEGLQIKTNDNIGASWNSGVYFSCDLTDGANNITFDSCILKKGAVSSGSGFNIPSSRSYINLNIINSIIYDFSANGITSQGSAAIDTNKIYLYNSVIEGCYNGVNSGWGGYVFAKNSAVFNTSDDFVNGFLVVDYCASDDGDGNHPVNWTGGANDWANVFVDYANGDYHLKNFTGTGAIIDQGDNLSAEGFTDDIDGEIRTGTWDIGADEYNASYQYTVVTLVSPSDGYSTSNNSIIFNCSASDNLNLKNITLYGNWSSWHANETVNISGTSNSTIFIKTLSEGSYTWNCLAYDNDSNSDWGDSNYTLTVDTTPPNVTSISDSPDPQGLGENVTISAIVIDNIGIDTVLIGITPPGCSETNYTMTNQSSTYTYNYLNWINGIYNYTIYAKDFSGNLNNSGTGSFELYSDIYLHVKTLKDTYDANEIVNITDPFEFALNGLSLIEISDDVPKANVDGLDNNAEEVNDISVMSKIFTFISGFFWEFVR